MEKIININFQGRVIAIEETAYNNLKQYIDGLRAHFANEESRDEVMSDIENRIAELLSERLKRGATCIGITELNAVIDSIGRIEDIEAAEGEEQKTTASNPAQQAGEQVFNGRFVRNADDKVIAGVCSGIALRTGIDPLVVRILFVLLFGALFWIYILLWIIVPSQSISTNITRRLYRNPDNKMIAGVCGGLAAYFRIDSWIPRLIFAAPLVVGVFTQGIHTFWWQWPTGLGNRIFVGSMGSTFLILYVVLWIALPFASSSTDKLEMRGEKIDINSIKTATQANVAAPQRQNNSGIGRVIGILFKAFFLFIAGSMALGLFGVLIGLVSMSFITFPLMDFVLDGWNQNFLVWASVILFLGIPMLALITWIVRRLIGARSHRHYLGYVFAGLWIIGLVSLMSFTGIVASNFKSRSSVDEAYTIIQPRGNTLYFNAINFDNTASWSVNGRRYRWFNDWNDDNDAPFNLVNNDSLWLRSVSLNIVQSPDSLYHIYESKSSYGSTSNDATGLAGHISYSITQQDSIINLPAGFTIGKTDKFRNQQVAVTVEVPVGKDVQLSKEMHRHFNVNTGWAGRYRHHGHWSRTYKMTSTGIEREENTTSEDD